MTDDRFLRGIETVVRGFEFSGRCLLYLAAAVPFLLLIWFSWPASGREQYPGQYAQNGLSQRQMNWINTAKNRAGFGCCSTADGYRPDEADIDYDSEKGQYRVRVDGEWQVILDQQLVDSPLDPNPIGRAVAWWYKDEGGERKIRCFAPGGGM